MNENSVLKWVQKNLPHIKQPQVQSLFSGQTNTNYLINSKYILKIYISPEGKITENEVAHFKSAVHFMPILENTGYTPKVCGVFEDDFILQANAILTEYIEGEDLSNVLYKLNQKQKFNLGKEVGEVLKYIHQQKILKNQKYETQQLLNKVKFQFQEAKFKNLIFPEITDEIEKIINHYKPQTITDDFVLIHSDAHICNFIQTENGIKIIDIDTCELALPFMELRMMLHSSCMPANLTTKKLEKYYPEGSLLSWIKGVVHTYPKICPSKYYDEINLIALYEIVAKLNLPENIANKNTLRNRALRMFEIIFRNEFIETELMNL